jgi:hypothetical protein
MSFFDKMPMYVRLVWGALALFSFVGVVVGKPAGVAVGVLVVTMWVLMRIIHEAITAVSVLWITSDIEKDVKEKSQLDNDDKS